MPSIDPAITICLGALMFATNTGFSLVYARSTRRDTCFSLRPTIAASPYPAGYICSICSARERTSVTGNGQGDRVSGNCRRERPDGKPRHSTRVEPALLQRSRSCNAGGEKRELDWNCQFQLFWGIEGAESHPTFPADLMESFFNSRMLPQGMKHPW